VVRSGLWADLGQVRLACTVDMMFTTVSLVATFSLAAELHDIAQPHRTSQRHRRHSGAPFKIRHGAKVPPHCVWLITLHKCLSHLACHCVHEQNFLNSP
jgi:hypothetical protein